MRYKALWPMRLTCYWDVYWTMYAYGVAMLVCIVRQAFTYKWPPMRKEKPQRGPMEEGEKMIACTPIQAGTVEERKDKGPR